MAGAHDGMTPPAAALNVAISTDEEQPLGLLALVNSTLSHTSLLAPVHFHLIVPDGMRRPLRVALEGLFPAAVFRAYSLDGGVTTLTGRPVDEKYASWMSKVACSLASSLTNQRNWKSCLRLEAAHAEKPA